jgi:hypothetical protein
LKAGIEMNEVNNSPKCERASDLIAFLYDEVNDQEKRDFESHLKQCRACHEEVASFGLVRESITTWRDEVLSGFVSAPLTTKTNKKSALAAFRQFFDLSPLWLKGATAFAVLFFCVAAVLAIVKLQTANTQIGSIETNRGPVYTEQDLERLVKEALAKQKPVEEPAPELVKTPESPKPRVTSQSSQTAKSRRPLSRAEREQLAAELRLLSTADDTDLHLLGDRINQ